MPFWVAEVIPLTVRCLLELFPIDILFTPPFWFSGAEVEMKLDDKRNVGGNQPVSESVSVPAPRELETTPIATRSDQLHGTSVSSVARTGKPKFRR